jgi:hypothetical protein
MADAYIARMYGQTFAAIAERIEGDTVHFLTENYLRGVVPTRRNAAAETWTTLFHRLVGKTPCA